MKTLITLFLLTLALAGSGREEVATAKKIRIIQNQPKSIVCFDGEKVYLEGESWICKDRCNTCKCIDGQVASTKMFCERP